MSVSESEKECPLCMEPLDWDDLGFFPCSCGYQICRFCWHRLKTDENGLCPACRRYFSDSPSFNPEISAEELKKQKKRNKERRSNKDQVFKPQDLATLRVVQKNLVFVIGLSSRLTQEDLKKEFAHFGKIIKFVHNKSTAYITYSKPEEAIRAIRTLNASAAQESVIQHLQFQSQLTNGTSPLNTIPMSGTTTTATIPLQATANLATTFNNNSVINNNTVASLNLLSATTTTIAPITATTTTTTTTLNNNSINNNSTTTTNSSSSSILNAMSIPVPPNRLKASLGTTKYCNHFLRSQQCPKVGECMYLHEIAEAEASFTKEQMQAGKHVEYEKKLMDSYLAKLETSGHFTNLVMSQPPQLTSHSRNHQLQQPQTLQAPTATITHQQSQAPPPPPPPLPPPQQAQQTAAVAAASLILPQLQQQLQLHQTPLTSLTSTTAATTTTTTTTTNPQQLLQQQHQQHQLQRQQQQSLAIDTDSEDDGLDFDPISVSTRGLRDLLDQQVQQAKQLQMQNYFQQLNSNQTLTNVLFQQQNGLNHRNPNNSNNNNNTATNGLLGQANFIEHQEPLPSIASLTNNSSNQQQQPVSWQNLSAWTSFLQRYGFENGR